MYEAVSDKAGIKARNSEQVSGGLERFALFAIAAFACAQLYFIFRFTINWDEFYFLSLIHEYKSGQLTTAFQTFHVTLLSWLTWLPGNEIDHIIYGRLFMLLMETITVSCLYLIGRHFFAPRHVLFAVLAYLSSGFVPGHGVSFRADPLVTALLMSSLYCFLQSTRQFWLIAAAALLAAVASLISVKSLFYFPAFAAIALFQMANSDHKYRELVRVLLTGLFAAGFFVSLYLIYQSQLPAVEVANTTSQAGNALNKTVMSQNLFPRAYDIVWWAKMGYPAIALLMLGIVRAIMLIREEARLSGTFLLLLLFQLACLAVYRNAFPYFFPFLLVPVMLLTAAGTELLDRRPVYNVVGLLAMIMAAAMQFAYLAPKTQTAQRQTIAAVHEIFPKPVAYLDRNGMISSFKKSGFFMSTWGLEVYVTNARPAISAIVANHQPPLLLLNSPALRHAVGEITDYSGVKLHPADIRVLRENYLPHWGKIWVAGKRLQANAESQDFIIAVTGVHTIEARSSVWIDDREFTPGETVDLSVGKHQIRTEAAEQIILRWGDRLVVPKLEPVDDPLYYAF